MMRRRGFLGSLLGLAATPVLASLGFTVPEDLPIITAPQVLPTFEGHGALISLFVVGVDKEPRPGGARVLRPGGGELMSLSVNGFGGASYWSGGTFPLMFLPNQPLAIDFTENVNVTANYFTSTGKARTMRLSKYRRTDTSCFDV